MSFAPANAFLALWNSISDPGLQTEYETWHTFEHVPERVSLPDFIEARRYRSTPSVPGGTPRYFTCYWLASLAALSSTAYRELIAHPTPWSARMRTELRDFLRLPCELAGSHGNTSATRLSCLHLRLHSAASMSALENALALRVRGADLVCAHWGWIRMGTDFPIANVNSAPASTASDIVLMLQHFEPATLTESTRRLLQSLDGHASLLTQPVNFELLSCVRQDGLEASQRDGATARPELLKHFHPGVPL